jgi:hypothetical protein
LAKALRTTVTSAIFASILFFTGCGSGMVQGLVTPSISQILPQTIAAGSKSLTMKVLGSNFSNQAVILWNGTPLATSVVDSGTLSSTIGSNSLAVPSTAQLEVRDVATKAASQPVQVTISAPEGQAANTPLSISVPSLPKGVAGSAYSAKLTGVGGRPPYTWSVTKGKLPSGLRLSSTGGVISGTPTASGYYAVGITAVDSSRSVHKATVSLAIAIAPATVAPPPPPPPPPPTSPSSLVLGGGLVGGSAGVSYTSSLSVSGGTPAYTWKVSGGSLPAGLSLAATSGVISGTPTASGTSNFTLSVSDSSSPVQTKSSATSISIAAASAAAGTGHTWYVRPDGGTRFSSNVATGQCDGTADASYASTGGTGTNQHCAFNDVRLLWSDASYTDGTTFPGWGWIGSGGDTYIIRGSIGTGASYRVGWNSASTYCDSTGCWGITGNGPASGAPVPPSGTAGQHTRILGENYASCHSASAKTQLHGGWGVGGVLNMSGASYVDVACMDITDFSACGRASQQVGCDSTQDFAQNGVQWSNTSTNDTLTDVHIHGMASSGMLGPTGNGVVMSYLDLLGNASSGWNADDGDGTTGVGSLLVQNFNVSWNGCAEEYPVVDALPYNDCTDQNDGGYGDGFGTSSVASPAPGWQVHFDQGVVSYNTQDGLDALHISGPGSTMTDTRVLAYGNMGNQLKVGGATATMINNVIVGNCKAMSGAIPGAPTTYNAHLSLFCRAGNTAVLINLTPGDPAIYQYNTLYSNGSVGLEVEYATNDTGPTNTLSYNNNVFLGFLNTDSGSNSSPIYSNTDLNMLTNPGGSWTNNATFGQNSNWPCKHAGESNAICTDPGLVDETFHLFGYGNMAPATGSILEGAGVAIPGVTVDYNGQTRKSPPSIGAYE